MSYNALGLIQTARSLADLQNSKNITYRDQLDLINESYRDLYSRYTESDGDYFVSEYVFSLSTAWVDPTVTNGSNFLVPLPDDFYKIRYLDYQYGGQWFPVDVFSTSQRDFLPGPPRYRIKNSKLWLILSPGSAASFRLAYYTPPAVVSAPDDPKVYGAAIPAYNKPLATRPVFVAQGNTLVYVYNGTAITAESLDSQITTVLFTAAGAVTWLTYWKGYLYWIQGGNILRAPTDLTTSPLVPVTVVNTANVTDLSVVGDRLYWYNGTNTIRGNLDGSGQVVLFAGQSVDYTLVGAALPVYLTASPGNLTVNGVVVLSNILRVQSDGTYLYSLDTLGNLSRLTLSAVGAVTLSELLVPGVETVGPVAAGFIPAQMSVDSGLAALSVAPNTQFPFPTNEVNEILQYLCAVGFARKALDMPKVTALQAKLDGPGGLWDRFWAVNKRDEYQFQRVNDAYQSTVPGIW